MEFEIETKELKKVMTVIKAINTDVNMDITSEGIGIKVFDTSTVCFLEALIKQPISIDANIKEPLKIGFNTAKFLDVLKRFNGKVKINIGLSDVTLSCDKKKISLKQMAIAEETKSPELSFNASCKIQDEDFKNILADATITETEAIRFVAQDSTLMATSGEMIRYETEVKTSESVFNGRQKGTYAIEYLEKALGIFDTLKFEFSSDYPCKLSGETDKLKMSLVVAPRVTDDEPEMPEPKAKEPKHINDGELDVSTLPDKADGKTDVEFLAEMDSEK